MAEDSVRANQFINAGHFLRAGRRGAGLTGPENQGAREFFQARIRASLDNWHITHGSGDFFTADGHLTREGREEVRLFQGHEHILGDGIIGPQTMSHINHPNAAGETADGYQHAEDIFGNAFYGHHPTTPAALQAARDGLAELRGRILDSHNLALTRSDGQTIDAATQAIIKAAAARLPTAGQGPMTQDNIKAFQEILNAVGFKYNGQAPRQDGRLDRVTELGIMYLGYSDGRWNANHAGTIVFPSGDHAPGR
jgi:hypothetical protein